MVIQCGTPINSKKHHLFIDDDVRSLCMKWLYSGDKYSLNIKTFGTQHADCKACAKRIPKMREEKTDE